jgi:hypothetical protein
MTQNLPPSKGNRRHPKQGLAVTYVRNSSLKGAETSRRQAALLRKMVERTGWKFIDLSDDA